MVDDSFPALLRSRGGRSAACRRAATSCSSMALGLAAWNDRVGVNLPAGIAAVLGHHHPEANLLPGLRVDHRLHPVVLLVQRRRRHGRPGQRGHLPRSLAHAGADENRSGAAGLRTLAASAAYLDQFGGRFGVFRRLMRCRTTITNSRPADRVHPRRQRPPDDDRPLQGSLADSSRGDRVPRLSRPIPSVHGIDLPTAFTTATCAPHEQAQQEPGRWPPSNSIVSGTRLRSVAVRQAAAAAGGAAPRRSASTFHGCRSSTAVQTAWTRLMDPGDHESWNGRFDAVILNGCIEHFVQVEDMQFGRADEIYRAIPDLPSGHRSVIAVAADGHHHDPSLNERTPKRARRADERPVRRSFRSPTSFTTPW